jgi:hypothetical protein
VNPYLEPSRTFEATVATVMGSASPMSTLHAFSGFPPLFDLVSMERTTPTLYRDMSTMLAVGVRRRRKGASSLFALKGNRYLLHRSSR